jgi:hypothetical protein
LVSRAAALEAEAPAVADRLVAVADERALWSRYGL